MLLLKLKMQKKSIKSVLLPIAFSIGLLSGVAHAGMKEGVAAFMAGNGGLVVKELAPLDHDGNPIVHGLLSRVYWTGLTGVPKDRSLAAAYAQRALPGLIKEADGGSGLAQSTLSILYREGNGVEKDCIKAVDWAKRSADQNDPTGLMAFGALYAVGSCQPKDDEKAAMWSRKAAESGHGGAQSNIGWNYENGRGVAKDEQQALYWFIKAAEQGVANAQLALGLRHATGRGVQKDDQLAVQWYQKAADQGLAQAQLTHKSVI
jgi:TPR repeat protein